MTDATGTVSPAPGGADPATGTPATPDVKFVAQTDFDEHRAFLNKEFQARRKETDGLAAQLKEAREVLETLKPATAATGEGKGSKDLPTAEIERKVKALEDQLQRSEREKAEALISTAVTQATEAANADAKQQEVLRGFLRSRARVEAVNGDNVVVVDGESGPERLTADWVRKAYGESWYPSSGKPGTGLPTGGGATASGVDFDLAMKDQAYFDKNKAAVIAEMDRRRKAGG